MTETHGQEKRALEADFQGQLGNQAQSYEVKLNDLGQMKDGEREAMRIELQKLIDELKRQIEEEKMNMGAAGKRREEELLGEIQRLKEQVTGL